MVSVRVSGGIPPTMTRDAIRDVLTALKSTVAGATAYALTRIRQDIRARSTSTRLPNIIGSRVYPGGGTLAFRPAGEIFPRGSNAELILRQMAEGAVIYAKGRRALAIPLHNSRDWKGRLLPPRAFPGLVFLPSRKGGPSIGVLALPTNRTKRGALRAEDRRKQAAVSRSRVQPGIGEDFTAMFVLTRSVTIPRLLDIPAIMRQAEATMPGLMERALSQAQARRGSG